MAVRAGRHVGLDPVHHHHGVVAAEGDAVDAVARRVLGKLVPVVDDGLAHSDWISSGESLRRVARARLSSCSTLVALAMGAVTPGCAISQASATSAGFASCAFATASSAASTLKPRSLRYFSTPPARAALFFKSALLRYLPERKPEARL